MPSWSSISVVTEIVAESRRRLGFIHQRRPIHELGLVVNDHYNHPRVRRGSEWVMWTDLTTYSLQHYTAEEWWNLIACWFVLVCLLWCQGMCVCVCMYGVCCVFGDRRKDCLRQFLVVLYERRELELLVNLTYRDRDVVLEGEVVDAISPSHWHMWLLSWNLPSGCLSGFPHTSHHLMCSYEIWHENFLWDWEV